MDTRRFIDLIVDIPNRLLKEEGLEMDMTEKNEYLIKEREFVPKAFDGVINIANEYNLEGFCIGVFEFKVPHLIGGKIAFGRMDLDHVVLNEKTGEIEMISYENFIVNSLVAKSAPHFLDAIYWTCYSLNIIGETEGLWLDNDYMTSKALECAQLAGGQEYLGFYETLIGVE